MTGTSVTLQQSDLRERHRKGVYFRRQAVPCLCFGYWESSVANHIEPCWWYSQCWGRRWTQSLSTGDLSNGLLLKNVDQQFPL